MSSTKFIAIMPQEVVAGDKVRVKGTIVDGANDFSINFANETCRNPQDISYHFKWLLNDSRIVENYKENGEWMEHKEMQYNQLDGRFSKLDNADHTITTNYFRGANSDSYVLPNSYSVLGRKFTLEFAFQDDGCIYVYIVYDEGRNTITKFESQYNFSDIKSVQVWGDVDRVNELAFLYN